MKRKLLYLFVLFTGSIFGQNNFELTPEGYNSIVTEIPGKSAAELYKKTKDWIQTFYKNPDVVLKGDIENDEIRIEAFCNDCFVVKNIFEQSCDYQYTLLVSFKDGKYKFDYIVGQLSSDGTNFLYTYRTFFKSDKTVRKAYQRSFDTMNLSVVNTYSSLDEYLNGKTAEKKKDW